MSQYFIGIKLKLSPLQHVKTLHRYQTKIASFAACHNTSLLSNQQCFLCSMSQYFTGIKLKMLLLQHVTMIDRYQRRMHFFVACHKTSEVSN